MLDLLLYVTHVVVIIMCNFNYITTCFLNLVKCSGKILFKYGTNKRKRASSFDNFPRSKTVNKYGTNMRRLLLEVINTNSEVYFNFINIKLQYSCQ